MGAACLVPDELSSRVTPPSVMDPPPLVSYSEHGAYIEVLFSECLACDEQVVDASCTATVDDGEIQVHSELTLDVRPRPLCEDVCTILTTTCPVPDLEPGTYTLRYGDTDAETVIEVPSSAELVCAGDG